MQKIKQAKNDGIQDFFYFFGLSGYSGKLIIFLYPSPSTGEQEWKSSDWNIRLFNDFKSHFPLF
jgi:hypothetical protein